MVCFVGSIHACFLPVCLTHGRPSPLVLMPDVDLVSESNGTHVHHYSLLISESKANMVPKRPGPPKRKSVEDVSICSSHGAGEGELLVCWQIDELKWLPF